MKTMKTMVGLAIAALALAGAVPSARAASCAAIVGGGHYECQANNDAGISAFELDFDDDGRTVRDQNGSVLSCFCSSNGNAARPKVETGAGITCVDPIAELEGFFLSARARGKKLTQGTAAAFDAGAAERAAFLCNRTN